MHPRAAYEELIRRIKEQALLASCSSLLSWDEETFMPRGGVEHRGNQMALLAGMHHQMATAPHIGELLDVIEASEVISDPYAAPAVNVRAVRRSFNRHARLPRELVEELARVTSFAQQEWVAARHNSDYGRYCPWLEKVVRLKREEAEALGYASAPYDAMLEEYEPGLSTQELTALFSSLRKKLTPLVERIRGSKRRADVSILRRNYPIERQEAFCRCVSEAVGFDFERGRLDTTTHPFFSPIGPGDCRITTRYELTDFNVGFFSMLHEVGHGLYEQGLDPEQHGTPMGEAASLSMHESQARLWENTVGRSLAFWKHFFPLARKTFPEALGDVSVEAFHFATNHVEPSLNRVQADQATYNLHILVRFEIEQALMSGDLRSADVPTAWNEKYRRYLGVMPANDREGCLQDGHWSGGLMGYFPTYTLGNILCAQLYAQVTKELGDLSGKFEQGRFDDLLNWLSERVFQHGRRYSSKELIQHLTGAAPDHRCLVKALERKYGELYDV